MIFLQRFIINLKNGKGQTRNGKGQTRNGKGNGQEQ